MQLRDEGIVDLPQDLPVIQTYHRIAAAFPGGASPAEVVIEAADIEDPQAQQAITALRSRARASGEMNEPIGVQANDTGTVAVVSVPLIGDGEEPASRAALRTLQGLVRATVGQVDGVTAVLLLVSFRSVVVALTAITLNLLSVAAAYGTLVLVFERGIGARLIGLQSTGAIVNWVPLFLFVILFGLSMDYHVFILSRIREGYDRGLPTRTAISSGITSSAGVLRRPGRSKPTPLRVRRR